MKIKISLDTIQYNAKPDTEEAKKISLRIGDNPAYINNEDCLYKFAEAVGAKGMSWSPATFNNGYRKKDNFEQMQFFVLDFDGGIAWQEVSERSKKYNLPILFAYDTFSSINHDRFRVVFLNDISIADKRVANTMIKALRIVFPECDEHCEDITHFYYGGKGLIYFNKTIPEINIELLFRNMCFWLKNKYGDTHYKRKIYEFAESTGLGLNQNKMLDVYVTENCAEKGFGKISPNPIILQKHSGEKLPTIYYALNFEDKSTKSYSAQKIPKNHDPCRSSDIHTIRNNCRLFREFESGKRWLYHNELFGLAVSLIQFETGKKVFLDILLANSHFKSYMDKYNQWDYYLDYFKKCEYKPKSCDSFCPYKDECMHGTNILSSAKLKHHGIIRLANHTEKYYPIEEASDDAKQKIANAVNSVDNMVHVVKAQTAIGKTQTYLELMAVSDKPFLIAVPTNILKHDVYERAIGMDIDIMETPSLHETLSKNNVPYDVQQRIKYFYQEGKNHLVIPYIKKKLKEQDIPCLREYLDDLKAIRDFDGHIITTHRKLLNFDEETLSKYEIIIDEDIISKSVIPNQETITIPHLKNVLSIISPSSALADKIRRMLEYTKTDYLFKLPQIEYDEEYDDISVAFDISSFCRAEHFCSRKVSEEKNLLCDCISFFKPLQFKDMKYTAVSATADETIYNYYFGADRVQFYNCKKALNKGTLIQYHDKSMSRVDIGNNYEDVRKRIEERCGVWDIITFKEHSGNSMLYIGSTEGCDWLAGKNITVIATPHYPPFLYKLFAYTIGLDFDVNAELEKGKLVKHNGYMFRFTTFNDEVLKNIQFWMIESELEQAVGRARLLRHECTVNLFSNFPLNQTHLQQFGWGNDLK